jgi:hypothetical protein
MTKLLKKNIKLVGIIFLFGIMAFGGCVYLLAPRPPKEIELVQNFNEHRAAFEQLRNMLQADTNLSRVASWGVETHKPFFLGYPSENNFPTDRFKQYLALLKQANGYVGVRSEGTNGDPGIMVWGWGFAGNTRHIWICWLDQTPTNQIPTIDRYHGGYENIGFKHIDQNWYLATDL